MFTLDSTLDAVQTGQKTFVKTFVQNDRIAQAMNEYVDTQTEYTKKALKATSDMFSNITSESVKAMQEASKFDLTKINETFTSAFAKKAK
jgi:hypothetical protein